MLRNMILVMLGGGIGAVGRESLMLVVPNLQSGSDRRHLRRQPDGRLADRPGGWLGRQGRNHRAGGKLLISTGMMGGLSTFSSLCGERTTCSQTRP